MTTPTAEPREIATHFLQLAAAGHAHEAFALYAGPHFRHHNPWFPGDAQSLMVAMDENAARNPDKVLDIQRTLEDGDLVAVHSHVRQAPDDRGAAVVHLFRFEGGKVVELWDLGQPVPEASPNEHGMF
ncbi:nuclear transport factor 2 family protein [Lysobacter fragariae]